MNTFQLRSGFLSKKTLLCCLSVFSVAAPVALPLGILGTTSPAEAQGVLIARGGAGSAARFLPKMLDMLTAAFGFGSAVIDRLPQPAPRTSLTQRQVYLIEGVRSQQLLYYQGTGGSFIPLSDQTVNTMMVRVGAYPNEAKFVATAMYYFGSR